MSKVSFQYLLEAMQQRDTDDDGDAPLQGSGVDSKAVHVIRTGLNLRSKQECGNFWEDFLQVCNNTDGMSELLDVRPDQIARWSGKIREMLDKVNKSDSEESGKKDILNTGGGEEPKGDPTGNPRMF
jgi:hypothetical protein